MSDCRRIIDVQPKARKLLNLSVHLRLIKNPRKEKTIKSFQLAGSDKVFYPATAQIDKSGTLTLISSQVKTPVAVRYCFTNDGLPNLFDVNGLPLIPFRTDKW